MTTQQPDNTVTISTSIKGWQQQEAYALEKSPARYATWLRYADAEGLLQAENLLPQLHCHCPTDIPAFMHRGECTTSEADLRARIRALEPWGFWFRLAPGINSKKIDIHGRNRITCRSHLISSTVEKLLGKNIGNSTVLDIGCHSGFFSLDMASRGVRHVTGVELRNENLRQAEFLKNHYGIANAHFEQGDIVTWQPHQPYTVVLNLGLVYHMIDPIALVRRTFDWCSDFAVIDTICHHEPVSAYIAAFNKDPSQHAEGLHTAELHPTYRALIDTMHDAGFVDLLELTADAGENGRVADLYRTKYRRCIVGFKRPMADVLAENGLAINFSE